MNIIGDVRGRKVIIVDDMIDTAGTLCNAAKALVEIGGATDVIACANPWRTVRSGSGKNREQRPQRGRSARHHSAAEELQLQQDYSAAGCSGFCRGNRAHLSGQTGFSTVCLILTAKKGQVSVTCPFFPGRGVGRKMKYICYCDQVTEQDVLDAIGNGARTVPAGLSNDRRDDHCDCKISIRMGPDAARIFCIC